MTSVVPGWVLYSIYWPTRHSLSSCPARDISVPLSEIYCTHHVSELTLAAAPRLLSLLEQSPGPHLQSRRRRGCFRAPTENISGCTVLAHQVRKAGRLLMHYTNGHIDNCVTVDSFGDAGVVTWLSASHSQYHCWRVLFSRTSHRIKCGAIVYAAVVTDWSI